MDKRIAVVTGANRGIGLEICRQLADAGLCVVLTSRDESKGKAALDGLGKSDDELCFHQLDVTSDDSVSALAAFLESEFACLDVLVNNAGILFENDRSTSVLDQSTECFHTTMEANFYGPLRVCQGLATLLRKSTSARVVNVSSGLGQLENMEDHYPAYGVSMTALNALTRLLAGALADDGVLVNAMSPGLVATDMGGPQGRPVNEGADTATWLALMDNDGPTGGFFRDRESIPW